MVEPVEELSLNQLQKNQKTAAKKKKKKNTAQGEEGATKKDEERLTGAPEDNQDGPPGIRVLMFDSSVDNHFKAVDLISKLCGGDSDSDDSFDQAEIQRLSSSITFLREWRHFNYQPRSIRFACQSENSQGKDVTGGINLPQFSAATVPKDIRNGNTISLESSKDFVMYVGGHVWALDWCPRDDRRSDYHIKSEFIAVAAHPPESSYHKIGAPLTGRGVIQIWCLLNVSTKEENMLPPAKKKPKQNSRNSESRKIKSTEAQKPRGRPRKRPINDSMDDLDCNNQDAHLAESTEPRKPRGRPRKRPMNDSVDTLDCNNQDVHLAESTEPRKPRGRPRKRPINDSMDNLDCNNPYVPLAVQFPKDYNELHVVDGFSADTHERVAKEDADRKWNGSGQNASPDNLVLTASANKKLKNKARKRGQIHGNHLPLLTQNESEESFLVNPEMSSSSGKEPPGSSTNVNKDHFSESDAAAFHIPKDVALPRVVFCLAHNGKVAWDVKWRPSNFCDTESKHRMGYLAVLLGNGALEVWEVPDPGTIKVIYSACQKESSDPRFIKLEPVFRCSMLKCGDRQSIPLTVEWSSSSPHDLILAGCHDGVVALWRFSAKGSSKDMKPLLCFSADTVPIRAVAWAPVESDPEGANIIVTAGHRGLKFWDIRDPFRPLWDLNPVQRVIYSLDWLPDRRCVMVSFDDGTLRILSLAKAACDIPVTGKPFVGTQQQGFHSYFCSSFAIWSVQVSPLTGMVAYCCADGTVLRFQLTARAVEKDPLRNRAPHFLCGSLIEEESDLIVFTPLSNIPFPMKKSSKRAKEQTAKGQPSADQLLALSDGDDRGIAEDTILAQNSNSSKEKPKADQALVCIDEERENKPSRDKGELGNEIEVFPPKIVAMNRVRWNRNKGSERWLCYGGAGGIVRCQEVDVSGA